MGKLISSIYKYDKLNWTYPSTNTTFFIPQHSETYIQTQLTSAYYASVGAHALTSSELYQITNNHGNTDVKDNYDSQSFETPKKNHCISACFW